MIVKPPLPHGSTSGGDIRGRWSDLAEAIRILKRRPDLAPLAERELDRIAAESQETTKIIKKPNI
jgi:hypothetical protein